MKLLEVEKLNIKFNILDGVDVCACFGADPTHAFMHSQCTFGLARKMHCMYSEKCYWFCIIFQQLRCTVCFVEKVMLPDSVFSHKTVFVFC